MPFPPCPGENAPKRCCRAGTSPPHSPSPQFPPTPDINPLFHLPNLFPPPGPRAATGVTRTAPLATTHGSLPKCVCMYECSPLYVYVCICFNPLWNYFLSQRGMIEFRKFQTHWFSCISLHLNTPTSGQVSGQHKVEVLSSVCFLISACWTIVFKIFLLGSRCF